MASENLETGAASLFIEQTNGALVVKHGQTEKTLLAGPLPKGGWDKIINGIMAAAPDAVGVMRDND